MSPFAFRPNEYRRHGLVLAGAQCWAGTITVLLSRSYGLKHPVFTAALAAQRTGLEIVRLKLLHLAREEGVGADLEPWFYPLGQAWYRPPLTLPGCSDAETKRLTHLLQIPNPGKNKEGLTARNLATVHKFFAYVSGICEEILRRILQKYEGIPPYAVGIEKGVKMVGQAVIAVERELHRGASHG